MGTLCGDGLGPPCLIPAEKGAGVKAVASQGAASPWWSLGEGRQIAGGLESILRQAWLSNACGFPLAPASPGLGALSSP